MPRRKSTFLYTWPYESHQGVEDDIPEMPNWARWTHEEIHTPLARLLQLERAGYHIPDFA